MKNQLSQNPHNLLVYFNVMILSKAFKLNKVLLLNTTNDNNATKTDENPSRDSSRPSSLSGIQPTHLDNSCQLDDYDADAELSIHENFFESSYKQRLYLNGYTSHSKYRYDLILFPRILELCLTFISSFQEEEELPQLMLVKTKQNTEQFEAKFTKTITIIEQFSKRLLYLLESCNFNIHILINQNFRHFFIDLIRRSFKQMQLSTLFISENLNNYNKIKQQSTNHYFDILYYISLYDLNETFLNNLFRLIIDADMVEKFLLSTKFNFNYLNQLLAMVKF